MVALRPSEELRPCPNCSAANAASDLYCTGCGFELAPVDPASVLQQRAAASAQQRSAASASERTEQLPGTPTAVFSVASPPSRRWPLRLLGGVAALALASTIAFAVLWTSESSRADRLEAGLAATRTELATTEERLEQTQAKLTAATALAEQRRSLLVQARTVLSSVDALLSSVDDIQGRAREMQTTRYTFSSDADALIATTVTLINYLVETESDWISYSYVNGLIDEANAELDVIRAVQYQLGEEDSAYDTASSRFGNRADSFSKAVRGLQRQLKAAVDQ